MTKLVVHIFYNNNLFLPSLVNEIGKQISSLEVKDIELVPNIMDTNKDKVMSDAYGISQDTKRITSVVLDAKNNELFRAEGNNSTSILTTIQMGLKNYER